MGSSTASWWTSTLDLFGSKRPARENVDALEQEILAFLGHKDVNSRLLVIREIAA